jgi:hypothetical protein
MISWLAAKGIRDSNAQPIAIVVPSCTSRSIASRRLRHFVHGTIFYLLGNFNSTLDS